MKIRWRLALYGTAVAAIGMIIFAASLVGLVRRNGPTNQITSLGALADETAAAMEAIPAADFPPDAPLLVADLTDSSDPFVQVVTDSGAVLYRTATLDGADPMIPEADRRAALVSGEAITATLAGDDYRVQVRPWARSDLGTQGTVIAAQSAAAIDSELAGLSFVIWAAAVNTMIAAASVSWMVSGRAVRPLERLAVTTDAIGQTGDLSRRLPTVRPDDEVGALTTSFNTMLERLQDAQDQTAAALTAQRRFVADASHDLRSPLTTIRNNAGFLAERPDISEADRADSVDDILAEAERMSRLIDDLLDLASSDLEPDRIRVGLDLAAIAGDVVRRIQPRHAHAIIVVGQGPVPLTGDPDALTRVVEILVENACLHGESAVEVEVETKRDQARLAVKDRGPGIPEADIDRIFDRFYRVDQARSTAGSGLGLSIARNLVVAQGGSISAQNRPTGGVEVSVVLPLA